MYIGALMVTMQLCWPMDRLRVLMNTYIHIKLTLLVYRLVVGKRIQWELVLT